MFVKSIFFLLNIYSDTNQFASKYLKDTEVNIYNVWVINGDFNIRDWDWDYSYPFHLAHNNLLFNIADAFDLSFSYSTDSIFTRYMDNNNNSNSIINLIFLKPNSLELNSHTILSELWHFSDHTSLVVDIHIIEEFVQNKRHIIIKNSK